MGDWTPTGYYWQISIEGNDFIHCHEEEMQRIRAAREDNIFEFISLVDMFGSTHYLSIKHIKCITECRPEFRRRIFEQEKWRDDETKEFKQELGIWEEPT